MFHSVTDILCEIKCGRLVVIVDDEHRENEGDLVLAAEKATAENINFMIRFGRGLVCVPITEDRANALGLAKIPHTNPQRDTAFTLSVDAKEGVSTGISAQDRTNTIQLLASTKATRKEFDIPGHVFPLIASKGGIFSRPGHTEASIELMELAGYQLVAVICEIVNDDGTMARRDDLKQFILRHNLKWCSIKNLMKYRRKAKYTLPQKNICSPIIV